MEVKIVLALDVSAQESTVCTSTIPHVYYGLGLFPAKIVCITEAVGYFSGSPVPVDLTQGPHKTRT